MDGDVLRDQYPAADPDADRPGTPPGYETVERIALAFPDYAPRIFKAAGKPIPAYLLAQNGILLRLAETSGADPERLRRAIAELIDGSEPAGGVKGIT